MRICGKRNHAKPFALNTGERWAEAIFFTDYLAMCGLPFEHEGRCNFRVPSNISMADPEVDRLVAMTEIAKRTGHLGGDVVERAWRDAGLVTSRLRHVEPVG